MIECSKGRNSILIALISSVDVIHFSKYILSRTQNTITMLFSFPFSFTQNAKNVDGNDAHCEEQNALKSVKCLMFVVGRESISNGIIVEPKLSMQTTANCEREKTNSHNIY